MLLLPILATLIAFTSAPPRVISSTADNADIGIDPALSEIRIRFDQNMITEGYSLCQMGGVFPPIPKGKRCAWFDSRTLVFPVELKPGQTYTFSINCPGASNCISTNGEAATPHFISFRTAAEGEQPPAPLTPEAASAAAKALQAAIDARYAHRDLQPIDWPGTFTTLQAAIDSHRTDLTTAALARAMASALTPCRDLHLSLQANGFTLATHTRFAPANIAPRDLPKLIPDVKQIPATNPVIITGTIGEAEGGGGAGGGGGELRIGYINITRWSGDKSDFEPLYTALEQFKDFKSLIIDVRLNSGGNELLAREFAGCFLPPSTAPIVYSRHTLRDPEKPLGDPAAFTPPMDRTFSPTPTPDRPHFSGRVAVLMGPQNMSSCESFLQMMRHGLKGRAKLIGERSFGSTGNPRPVDLGCGITANIPTWNDQTLDGHPVEGRGLDPDILIEWKPTKDSPDPVLSAAKKWLLEKP